MSQQKLSKLREVMSQHKIYAYIIPSEDAHQSEYLAACDMRRSYISNFTGSAGLAVVTLKEAALWTDGRYFLQASKQLDSQWTLQKFGLPETPTKEEWLNSVLPSQSNVGMDPTLVSVSAADALRNALESKGHQLSLIKENLVDLIWNDRPSFPKNPVFILDEKYTGKSSAQKIQELKASLKEKNVWGYVVSALDEIAWLFNLRGSDISYNPIFFSYSIVTMDQVILYTDVDRITPNAQSYLSDFVVLKPYLDIFTDLNAFASQFASLKVGIDSRCSLALQEAVGGKERVLVLKSPIAKAKSIKTECELEGFRQCHVRDAVALVKYFAWLEKELKKKSKISECDGADKLESLRSELTDFIGLSFDTISSSGPNGAIIHYKPLPESCSLIDVNQMYLCDSGAQYKDGTTDVTRTMHFGTPTQHEKDCFTRVLKGHIQLDVAVFPQSTTGYMLDVLARGPLWKNGLDYQHGTGHGVGHFLNVHEGPHSISPRIGSNETPLVPGMTVTNEPGYYEDGNFGIRIENIMIVKNASTPFKFGGKSYYEFEHVTWVPIQTKLINKNLLTNEEVEWLNKYHENVYEKVSPFLQGEDLEWLNRETKSL